MISLRFPPVIDFVDQGLQRLGGMKIVTSKMWWLTLLILASVSAGVPLHLLAASPIGGQSLTDKGSFDGPAELPRLHVKTALADTPATGAVRLVKSDGNLQVALDRAACGDVIKIEAGATFTGHFLFPKKPCDDTHWIILRTSAPDDALPPEGTRLTPCYAGVPSLPGRPDFHCSSTRNVMAKVDFAGHSGSGPISFADGANHYRFIGIEITRSSPGASITALAGPESSAAANHIIFDRVWMHGTAKDETRRGLFLSGTTYIAAVDSFFSDFHCVARSGSCTDSQAIGGGGGDLPGGPYKIVNNFLEAAGENIIFGGGPATVTPADIEIRQNYFFKPITWMRGQPGFVGGVSGDPFIVKNIFELKNAQRVLFEGNILENSWGGFSQTGFAILLTPKNQNNGNGHDHLCPLCRVTDVTIRYCKIAHVGSVFQIANVPADGGAVAFAGERYSIHDVVIDDIDGKKYGGFGAFMVLLSNVPTLKDVEMDHVTAVSARVFLSLGVMSGKIQNLTFTNNLIGANERQLNSSGGGAANCAFQPDKRGPARVLEDCIDPLAFTNNAIISGYGSWPPGNFFPKNTEAVGFVKSGDEFDAFRLCKGKDTFCRGPSKYASAGSDHKDIGADIDLVNAATKGVL